MSRWISKASDVKAAVLAGWELWYVAHRNRLPGHWELRRRHQTRKVSWDAIVKVRRNLAWWEENTDEFQHGRSWCYRAKQAQLRVTHDRP